MKVFLVIIFFFNVLVSFGQKGPKQPKPDAIGKDALLEKYEHSNSFQILSRTKSVAILPASTAFYAKKMSNEELRNVQSNFSLSASSLQKTYYALLYKSTLSALLQDPETTNKILKERNLLDINAINKTPKNTLCFMLGVDGVLFIDVTLEDLKSATAEAALSVLGYNSNSNELAIGLRFYEKANGELVWSNFYFDKLTSKEPVNVGIMKLASYSYKQIPFLIK
jgi:hypothetical protein